MKKLSIITVCYNCEDLVNITLNSLISQTYQDFEYIIIDGNSTDNTLNNIKEYNSKFKNITIISEKDNGIYDAMNKGIKIATGKFIYFLNMGDKFYDNKVLEKVVSNLNEDIIYYGDAVTDKGKLMTHPNKIIPLYFIAKGMICHQCIFAPTKSLKNSLFDIKYKYCADEDWLINAIENRKIGYKHLPIKICYYDTTGVSSVNKEKVYIESMEVEKKYYSKIIIKLFDIKISIAKFIKKIIKYKA